MKTIRSLLMMVGLLASMITSAQQRPPLGINLENYVYPYPVHVLHFTSQEQGLEMAYMYEKAASPNGRTIVLLHGKNFCGAYWGPTMKALLARGYNVVVPDQIGFGKSTKPAHYQFTFQQLALNTRGLLDSLHISKAVILGHSMGGMVATRFALMYPDFTEKLMLVDPIGLEDWKLKVPYVPMETWYEEALHKTADGVRKYMQESYYHGTWKPAYEQWAYLQYGMIESTDYARFAWNIALTYDMCFTQPVCYEFKELKMPTVLIIGALDRTALGKNLVSKEVAATMGQYPELGKKVAAEIPNCKLITMEGVGHLPFVEDFDRFIGILLPQL